jgi:hypothetical protein
LGTFEEAILAMNKDGKRVLIVGNEGQGYVSILRAPVEIELCQTLSLNSQPRSTAPRLKEVLGKIGIRHGQSISLVGWKYLESYENNASPAPAFVPAFYVEVLRSLVGVGGKLVDGSSLLMHPQRGLRAVNSAAQIAAFEWAGRNASAAVFNILHNTRPGMSEMHAMQFMQYTGQPMTMHPVLASGKGEINGLRSPSSKIIENGDGIMIGLGYWGSLVCRAGLLCSQPDGAFFDKVAAPYFKVVCTWYQNLHLGASGRNIFHAVDQAFAGSGMHSSLNPGHLTSFEEWLSSPIRPDSDEPILSGMVLQTDIIPTPLQPGWLMNCEDTVAVADASLRAELKAQYPGLWRRVEHRRQLMIEALGIPLAEEVLPLSDGAAYLPPYWMESELVCSAA